jgi:hypothetical protein
MSITNQQDSTEPMIVSNARSPQGTVCRALVCAALAVALAGCVTRGVRHMLKENDCNRPQPYKQAGSIPPVQVPPGIDPPDTRQALRIPAYNEPAPPPRKLTDPCLDAPPLFDPSRQLVSAGTGSATSVKSKSRSRHRHFF